MRTISITIKITTPGKDTIPGKNMTPGKSMNSKSMTSSQEHEHTEQSHQLHYQTSTEGSLGYEEHIDEQEHTQEGRTLFESEDENQDE